MGSPTSRFRSTGNSSKSPISTLQTVLTAKDLKIEETSGEISQGTTPKVKDKIILHPQSVFSHRFVSTSTSATGTSSSSSSSSNLSSSPSPHCPFSSSMSSGLSPSVSGLSANTTSAVLLPPPSEDLDQAARPSPSTSESPSTSSVRRRLNMPKLESTLLLQSVRGLSYVLALLCASFCLHIYELVVFFYLVAFVGLGFFSF